MFQIKIRKYDENLKKTYYVFYETDFMCGGKYSLDFIDRATGECIQLMTDDIIQFQIEEVR